MKKPNKSAILTFLVLATVSTALIWGQGCQVEDMIQVQMPEGVQQGAEVEETVPLSQVKYVVEDWRHFFRMNTWKLEDNVERAQLMADVINSLLNIGLSEAGGIASVVPGGAIAMGALSYFFGLYRKQPGSDKVVAKEKMDSYNKGHDDGRNGKPLVEKMT